MCEPNQIAAYIRSALRLHEGRRLFVVEARNDGDGFAIEAVISDDEGTSPEAAMQEYCVASGREAEMRRCLPVVMPEGFDPTGEDYRLVREDDLYRIEAR